MNTEFLYLVAEQLYMNTAAHAMSNRNWLAAIYKSLLVANRGDEEEILWTKYNQWKIDHNCRAARSTAKANKSKLSSFEIGMVTDNYCVIHIEIQKDDDTISKEVHYRKDAFPAGLWEFRNPHNDTVLNNAFERDQLFLSSLKDGFNSSIQDEESVRNEKLANSKKPERLDISLYADIGDEEDSDDQEEFDN